MTILDIIYTNCFCNWRLSRNLPLLRNNWLMINLMIDNEHTVQNVEAFSYALWLILLRKRETNPTQVEVPYRNTHFIMKTSSLFILLGVTSTCSFLSPVVGASSKAKNGSAPLSLARRRTSSARRAWPQWPCPWSRWTSSSTSTKATASSASKSGAKCQEDIAIARGDVDKLRKMERKHYDHAISAL